MFVINMVPSDILQLKPCKSQLRTFGDLNPTAFEIVFQYQAKTKYNTCVYIAFSPSVLWRCRLGDRKGTRSVKKLGVSFCWCWRFDWNLKRLIAPVISNFTVILRCNKIRNGDILPPSNPQRQRSPIFEVILYLWLHYLKKNDHIGRPYAVSRGLHSKAAWP